MREHYDGLSYIQGPYRFVWRERTRTWHMTGATPWRSVAMWCAWKYRWALIRLKKMARALHG